MEPIIGIGTVLVTEDGELTVSKIVGKKTIDSLGNVIIRPIVHFREGPIMDGKVIEAYLES